MKADKFENSIKNYIKDRFEIEESSDFSRMLFELSNSELKNRKLLRIQRIYTNKLTQLLTWKTLLIVELKNISELSICLDWAALVKDALLEPESADLYLFIIFENDDINIEQSLRIESLEQFCRKYVQRPEKSEIEFLNRTFLSKLQDSTQTDFGVDPVNNALALTNEKHVWFDKDKQEEWKKIFLSNISGSDLLGELIPEIDEQQ